MTSITRLQSAFTGPDVASLPVLRDDPILVPGSLLLFEPAHPVSGWGNGVPADGGAVPNAAWREARDVINPALVAADTAGLYRRTGGGMSKRTSKGSIKMRRTASPEGLLLPLAFLDYLIGAGAGHTRYISWWGGLSYKAPANGAGFQGLGFVASHSPNLATASGEVHFAGSSTTVGGGVGGENTNPDDLYVGPRRISIGRATSGPTTLTSAQAQAQSRAFGSIAPFAVPVLNNELIFHRFYVEDLTVSGRSFAAVAAIDSALYTKHVLTAGGRYYGDDYTGTADAF